MLLWAVYSVAFTWGGHCCQFHLLRQQRRVQAKKYVMLVATCISPWRFRTGGPRGGNYGWTQLPAVCTSRRDHIGDRAVGIHIQALERQLSR